jgi:iron complex outermembrane receptor protein
VIRVLRHVVLLAGVWVAAASPLSARLEAQAVPHAGTRHLHGIVEDSLSGRPVDGAEVLVLGARTFSARSDGRGRFDFRDLPAARVLLRVRKVGYLPFEQAVDLTRDDALVVVHLQLASVTLSELTVTADTLADPLARVASVTTLNAADLAALRGQTLGETIKFLPGVSVIQYGPSVAKPVIRGLNSQRVLVMNSGLRQEDQQWGTEHAPNIDSFDADAVTVVRGAATVLYGQDAIGGVVRVDRAPPPDTGRFGGDIAVNSFTNSRQGALSVGVQGGGLQLPVVGAAGYRLRLTGRVAGNGGTPDYFLSNTGFRELNGSAALGITRGWGRADLLVSRFGTELGVLRQAHAGNFDDLQRAMTTAPRDSAFSYGIGRPNQRVAHTTARLRSTFTLRDDSELEVVYGFQYNQRREYDNHGPLRFRDTPAFHLRLFTNSLDVRWRHPEARGLRGTVGTSVLQQGNQTLGKGFLIPGFDLGQGALYAQEELALGRFTLSAGARGDVVRQTTLPYADLGIRSPAGTRSWNGFSGSVGGTYWLLGDLSASVRLARAWRPPTVNERYAQGVHHGTAQYELGDAALDPERSLGVEAALRYDGHRLSLDAATYGNRIDGFIYLRPTDPVLTIRGAFPGYRYAQTDARLRGVELAARWSPTERLELSATGNAVRGTNRIVGEPLFDMPADRGTVQARLTGRRPSLGRWHLGAGGVLVRRQDAVPSGTVYALPTAGYALLSLDAGSTGLRVGASTLDVSLSVSNALNRRYRDYLSRYRLFVDDAGRDVVLRVRAPF